MLKIARVTQHRTANEESGQCKGQTVADGRSFHSRFGARERKCCGISIRIFRAATNERARPVARRCGGPLSFVRGSVLIMSQRERAAVHRKDETGLGGKLTNYEP